MLFGLGAWAAETQELPPTQREHDQNVRELAQMVRDFWANQATNPLRTIHGQGSKHRRLQVAPIFPRNRLPHLRASRSFARNIHRITHPAEIRFSWNFLPLNFGHRL
jgi:hypothetical protein